MEHFKFNHTLACECAKAFSISTGLGCTVSDISGTILYTHGCGIGNCPLADMANISHTACMRAHNYGMSEAERFGGKYVYFCPLGLTCFVSPIIGEEGSIAKITVGPFLMVDLQDFIYCELTENLHLDANQMEAVLEHLEQIPKIEPNRVQELSVLLFMTVGFMNNVSAENKLLKDERSNLLQGQISAYITELKHENKNIRYPFKKEQEFLQAIAQHDLEHTRLLLKELLASLFAQSGANLEWIKARTNELITLVSRTAIEQGAEEEQTLLWLEQSQNMISTQKNFYALSDSLFDTVISFLDGLFIYPDAKHANLIHKCIQYISQNYAEYLTLEETAKALAISPDYLSRIFKQETGVTFNHYVNNFRIEKAKKLIRSTTLRLTDICHLVGYVDQSYFTKVFRRIVKMSPSEYSKCYSANNS